MVSPSRLAVSSSSRVINYGEGKKHADSNACRMHEYSGDIGV